jgi:hypothetical protein
MAAAHKEGPGAVRDYLKFQNENGWSSDFSKSEGDRRRFEAIETRLRLFQDHTFNK